MNKMLMKFKMIAVLHHTTIAPWESMNIHFNTPYHNTEVIVITC